MSLGKNFSTVGLASIATLCLATASLANVDNRAHTGLYAGLAGGYMTGDTSLKATTAFDTAKNPSTNLSARGVMGELSLGYGAALSANSPIYLAAELLGSLSNAKGKAHLVNDTDTRVDIKNEVLQKHNFGVAFKVGTLVNGFLPYLKLGVTSAKWELKSNITASNTPYNKKFSKHKTGFAFGLGVAAPVANKITAGVEFMHTRYGSMKFAHKSDAGTTLSTYSLRPNTNEIKAKLTFHM